MISHPDTPDNSMQPHARTPVRLLWTTGIVASAICVAAFVLWATHGGVMLFDMIVALCM